MSKTIAEQDLAEEPHSTLALNRAPPVAAILKKKCGRPKKPPTAIRGNLDRRPNAANRVPTATRGNHDRQPKPSASARVQTATRRILDRRPNADIWVPTEVSGNLDRQPKLSAGACIPTATRDNLDCQPKTSADTQVPTATTRGKRGDRRASATPRVYNGIHGDIAHVRGFGTEHVGEAVQSQERRKSRAVPMDGYTTRESQHVENREPSNDGRMRRKETLDDRADNTSETHVATHDRAESAIGRSAADVGRTARVTGRESENDGNVMRSQRLLDEPLGEGGGKVIARAELAIGEEAGDADGLVQSLKRRDERVVGQTCNTVDKGLTKAQWTNEVIDSSTLTNDELSTFDQNPINFVENNGDDMSEELGVVAPVPCRTGERGDTSTAALVDATDQYERSSPASASPPVPTVESKDDVSWTLFIRCTISTVLEHIGYVPRSYQEGLLYGPISTANGVYIAEHQSIRNQMDRNVPKIINEVMKGGVVVTITLTSHPSGGVIDSWDLLACHNCEISMTCLETLLRSTKQKFPDKPKVEGCSMSIAFKPAAHSHEETAGPQILRQTIDANRRTTSNSNEVYVDSLPDHPPKKHDLELLKFFKVESDSSRLRCLIPSCGAGLLVNNISNKHDVILTAMKHFTAQHKEVAVKTRSDASGYAAFIEWEDWNVLKDLHTELVDKWNKAFYATGEKRKAMREAFDDLMYSCDILYSRIAMYPDQCHFILMHGANGAELKRGLKLHHATVNQRDVEVLDVDCDEELLRDEAPTTVHTVDMPATSQAGHNTASGSKELACRTMKETTPDDGRKRSCFWSYFDKNFEVVDGQRTAVAYCKYCDARFLNSALQMAEHVQKCTKIVEELGSAGKAKFSPCRT